MNKSIHLNLGSGNLPLPGYINIDNYDREPNFAVDIVCDVEKVKGLYAEGTVDEIFAKDVLEHVGWRIAPQVLQDWISLLKEGGVLKLRVPDTIEIVQEFLNHRRDNDAENIFKRMIQLLFGDQDFPSNTHLGGFHAPYLVKYIESLGMRVEPVWYDGGRDIRITAIKGHLDPLVSLDHPDYKYKSYSREQHRALFK